MLRKAILLPNPELSMASAMINEENVIHGRKVLNEANATYGGTTNRAYKNSMPTPAAAAGISSKAQTTTVPTVMAKKSGVLGSARSVGTSMPQYTNRAITTAIIHLTDLESVTESSSGSLNGDCMLCGVGMRQSSFLPHTGNYWIRI